MLNFKVRIMQTFPNAVREPVKGGEVLSSDLDIALRTHRSIYQTGHRWHTLDLLSPSLKLFTGHVEIALVIGHCHILFFSIWVMLGNHM